MAGMGAEMAAEMAVVAAEMAVVAEREMPTEPA